MPVVFPSDASPASRAPSAASERTESACFESALALSSPPPHPAESEARATIRAVRLHQLAVRIGVRRFSELARSGNVGRHGVRRTGRLAPWLGYWLLAIR